MKKKVFFSNYILNVKKLDLFSQKIIFFTENSQALTVVVLHLEFLRKRVDFQTFDEARFDIRRQEKPRTSSSSTSTVNQRRLQTSQKSRTTLRMNMKMSTKTKK
jgi:hypothetical protein